MPLHILTVIAFLSAAHQGIQVAASSSNLGAPASDGSAIEVVRGYEDNVERVIDLEQMDRSEIEGRPLPSESPRGVRGGRPGNQGRPGVGRPGNRPDSRGAGTGRPIGDGW